MRNGEFQRYEGRRDYTASGFHVTAFSEFNLIKYAYAYEHDVDQASDYHTTSEPRTPSDHPRDRRSYQNSLLTLSDPDPFAAGAVIVPRFDQDPNRLSVYSDSSLLDPHAKRADALPVNRMSYGSSSSNSHGQSDALAAAPYQPVARCVLARSLPRQALTLL